MMRLKRLAREREEKMVKRANGNRSHLPDDTEKAGALVDEHADTWGFSWMPAIEEFVGQASGAQHRNEDVREDGRGGSEVDGDYAHEGAKSASWVRPNSSSSSSSGGGGGGGGGRDPDISNVELSPGRSFGRRGYKRRRPQSSELTPTSRRRSPRSPSYNETLLADKSFHNPHASETMADAFGILRPASFVLDVEADDRSWGGSTEAAAGTNISRAEVDKAGSATSLGEDRNWFYDTVRDRQNRLWADTRVRKGVELARKGQHQSAIDTYTQALGMCPDHDDGLVARGAAFATIGRLRQAMQDLSRALHINPDNENASSYLKETRRRMERRETRESPPGSVDSVASNSRRSEFSTGSGVNGRLDLSVAPAASTLASTIGSKEPGAPSRTAVEALLLDNAEGDALRKMRVLLEEDERKRKRGGLVEGEGRGGGGGGSEGGSTRKKKSRKKDRKSSSKSKRSSSSRVFKKREREYHGDEARYDSSTSSSSDEGSSEDDISGRSSSKKKKKSKKKKQRHHKHKKRSSTKTRPSVSPPALSVSMKFGAVGRGSIGATDASLSAAGGEDDSERDEAHPILQRKKHSLWG